MKKLLILLLSYLWGVSGLYAQELSPTEMRDDLRIFREALEKFHPEMYRYTSKDSFETLFADIAQAISLPLTQREFYKLLRPALVSLKDGHIKWIVQGEDQHYGFFDAQLFPIQLYFQEDKIVTLKHYGGLKIPALAEVVSINGIPIEELTSKLLNTLTYGDGESLGGKYYQLNRYFPAYFSTEFGVSESYSVEWIVNGRKETWTGNGEAKEVIESNFRKSQDAFSFVIPNDWTAILTIERFFSLKGEPDFSVFLKSAFDAIQRHGITNLIIDLRGNEGGNEKLGIELYQYLAQDEFRYYDHLSTLPNQKVDFENYTSKLFRIANTFSQKKEDGYYFTKAPGLKPEQPHELAFDGQVILLLDGQSFSVTTEFASRFQSDRRGIILGQETAGGAEGNSSGYFSIVTLPNSKIDLGIPRLGFHMADLADFVDPKKGVLPDQIVIPSAQDRLTGVDPVMELALKKVIKPSTNLTTP